MVAPLIVRAGSALAVAVVKKAVKKKVKPKPKPTHEVIDTKTGKVVGKPVSSLKQASRKVERLDQAYGGARHRPRKIKSK